MSNLLVNGGFDDGGEFDFPPWTSYGIFIIPTGTLYYNGTQIEGPTLDPSPPRSLSLSSFQSGIGGVRQTFSIVSGYHYRLSFALYISQVGGGSLMQVSVSNTLPAFSETINLSSLIAGNWYTFSYDFFANSNTSIIEFEASMSGVYGLSLDAVSIVQIADPCFSGNSIIRTKHIATGEIQDLPAKDVYSTQHLVLRTDTNEFVPIVFNARSGTTVRYRLFRKDVLGPDRPTEDLYITSGHRMIVNGINVKSGTLKEGVSVRVDKEPIYTICTEEECPIWVNGLDVMTYQKQKFLEYVAKKSIDWTDNTPDDNL